MMKNSKLLLVLFVLFFSFSVIAQDGSVNGNGNRQGNNRKTENNYNPQLSAEGTGEYFLVPAIVRKDPEGTAHRMNTCGAAILALLDKKTLGGLTDNEIQPLTKKTVLEIAESRFKMAIKYQPNNYLYYTNLASALYRQGKIDEALAAINRAIELNPENETAKNYQEAILRVKVEVRLLDDEETKSK